MEWKVAHRRMEIKDEGTKKAYPEGNESRNLDGGRLQVVT